MIFQIYHIIYMIWVVLILVNSSPKSFIVVAKSGFCAASSINRSPNSSLMNPSSTSRWTIRWTPSNVDSRFFTGMDCLGVGMVSSLLWFAMKFWEFCKWLCLDSLLKWVGFPDPGKRQWCWWHFFWISVANTCHQHRWSWKVHTFAYVNWNNLFSWFFVQAFLIYKCSAPGKRRISYVVECGGK